MTELSALAWRLRRCLLSLEREYLQLAEVWACLLTVAPELVGAPDRRRRLRQAIDELVDAGWLALPDDVRGFDHHRRPPLPRTVHVIAPTERATRLGAARSVRWTPALRWASDMELDPQQHRDLVRINEWLDTEVASTLIVPPRERSLELFGAGREDRLLELSQTDLFGQGRLSWELLACAPVPPPFVWSAVGPGPVLLVVSGHETFASVRRTLVEAPTGPIGVVAHGAGAYFASSVTFARLLDRPVERLLYYGDLAAADLRTPQRASRMAVAAGLPPVEPANSLYELLLRHGLPSAAPPLAVDEARELAGWLDEPLRRQALTLLVGGRRLVQEWVGYGILLDERIWHTLGVT